MLSESARDTSVPAPYILHPTPYTLHPAPYTLHPTSCTLHPASAVLTGDGVDVYKVVCGV